MIVLEFLWNVFQLLAIVFIFVVVFCVLPFAFNDHCNNKFGHRIATTWGFMLSAITTSSMFVGFQWYKVDRENGAVLFIIGVLLLSIMLSNNIKKTNVLYGFGSTFIMLSILGTITIIGGLMLLVVLTFSIILTLTAKPVFIRHF
ncbi:MAG: hypothetical protein Q4A74_08710 [Cardiobacteriaceae bacterium]|nr:hypothetical protein [Cardiobacteriaceae bacterium]